MNDLTVPLSARQLQMVNLWADTDLSAQQIGTRLGVTERTVQNTISQAYRRLNVHSWQHLRSVLLACELAPAGAR